MPSPTHSSPELDPGALLRHAGFVLAAAQAAIGRDDAVEDAVQETWAVALEKRPRDAAKMRAWLGRIARNKALDIVRRRGAVRRRETRAARDDRTPSTASVVERAELGRRLVEAVMALPEIYRDAILLRYYDGLSPKRIGRELGVPTETARTRVKRGLEKLREALDERHGGKRANWLLSLAPLLEHPATSGVGALLVGMWIVKKIAIVVVLLTAGLAVYEFTGDHRAPEDGPQKAEAPAEGHDPELAVPTLAAKTNTQPSPERTDLRGIVHQGGRPIAARVEVRRMGGAGAREPGHWYLDATAAVHLPPRDAPVLQQVESASDGRFEVNGLAPERYEIRAVAPDGAWGFSTVTVSAPAATARVDVWIHAGKHAVRGRCVHTDGRAFAGTIVLQQEDYRGSAWGRLHALARTEVAADGRFAIEGVAPGTYYLAAIAQGRSRAVRRLRVPTQADIEFVVDAGLRAVRGRVVKAGGEEPVPDASVVASRGNRKLVFLEHATRTGRDGRFTVLAGRDQAQLQVRAPGLRACFVRLAPGGDMEIEVALPPLGTVRGTVRSADGGSPVPGVLIYAVGLTEAGWCENEFVRATSDEEGRFELKGAPTGDAVVFAMGEAWCSPELATWQVPGANTLAHRLTSGSAAEIDLTVVPCAAVAGVVLDEGGAPCAGARVHIGSDETDLRARMGPLRSLLANSPLGADRTVWSDADGRFALPGLRPGLGYTVEASHAEHAPTKATTSALRGGSKTHLELRLEASHAVVITVLDEVSGAPLPGVTVRLFARPNERSVASTALRGTTGEDGRVRIAPLPAGRYAAQPEDAGAVSTASLADKGFEIGAEGDAELEIRVPRAKRISGRVVAPDGVSPQAVDLAARPADAMGARGGLLGRLRHAPIAADGSFSIEGLTADGYRLCASVWSEDTFYRAEADAAPGDTGVALALRATEPDLRRDGLRIRIRTSAGARVCQGYLALWCLREDGRPGGSSGVGFGSYPVIAQSVPRGKSLWIFVTGAKDETGGALPAGAVLLGPLEPEHATIDVTLPPGRTLRGRVTTGDGTGVPGVGLRALPANEPLLRSATLSPHNHPGARTGADGSFELHGLGDLDYEVHVDAPPGHAPVAPIRLRPRAEPLLVRLRPAAVSRLQVRDWSGQPVAGARVRYREDPGEAARRDRERGSESIRNWEQYANRWWDPRVRKPLGTDDRGALSLPDLDPGKHYELFVQGPASRHDLAPILEFDWIPKGDTTLAFGRVWRIQGVVQDPGGAPVAGVRVEIQGSGSWWHGPLAGDPDTRWRGTETDAHGRFSLEGLQVPEVQARTFLGARPPRDAPLHRLQAGAEAVTMHIDAGATLRIRVADWDPRFGQELGVLTPADGSTRQLYRVRADDEGRLVFRGLDAAETYTLWLHIRGAVGRHVFAESLTPGEDEVLVHLAPDERISGRVRYRGSQAGVEIHVQTSRGLVSTTARTDADGGFTLAGLPPGTYPVRAIAYRRTEVAGRPSLEYLGEVTVDVRAGERADIEIPAKPPR